MKTNIWKTFENRLFLRIKIGGKNSTNNNAKKIKALKIAQFQNYDFLCAHTTGRKTSRENKQPNPQQTNKTKTKEVPRYLGEKVKRKRPSPLHSAVLLKK